MVLEASFTYFERRGGMVNQTLEVLSHEKSHCARAFFPGWCHTRPGRAGRGHQRRFRLWRMDRSICRPDRWSGPEQEDEHAGRTAAGAQDVRQLGAILAAACGRMAGRHEGNEVRGLEHHDVS